MKHFLRCSSNEESQAIDMAIETISKSSDDHLTHTVVDYLMGETDGVPKVNIYRPLNSLKEILIDIYIYTYV